MLLIENHILGGGGGGGTTLTVTITFNLEKGPHFENYGILIWMSLRGFGGR